MAPPRKQIDRDVVRRAAEAGLSVGEIARVVGCNRCTLQRRFAKELDAGGERGVASIKLMLHRKAIAGSVAAMIFSLKNRAGWSDRHALTGASGGPIQHEQVSGMSDSELQAVIDAELKRSGLASAIDAVGAGGAG